MVLVDTSVWVTHLRRGDEALAALLNEGEVACHPFIIGELACGNLKHRHEVLSLLQALPHTTQVEHDEVLPFIKTHRLMGKGLGYVDLHLLASALLDTVPLWTLDIPLQQAASRLGIAYSWG